jgi:hypothetical protein
MRPRPLPVTIAAVLLTLLSLANLLSPLLLAQAGAVFVYSGVVLGVVGLIGAAGLWMLKRWSMWLTIIVCVPSILSAGPGIAFAPTPAWRVAALVGVIGPALTILLVVLPNSRQAYT